MGTVGEAWGREQQGKPRGGLWGCEEGVRGGSAGASGCRQAAVTPQGLGWRGGGAGKRTRLGRGLRAGVGHPCPPWCPDVAARSRIHSPRWLRAWLGLGGGLPRGPHHPQSPPHHPPPSQARTSHSQCPCSLGTAHRAWAGGRMVKAGVGVVSRVAGLSPGGGSRRYLCRRPANSRKSSDLARLSPTQTRRPAGDTGAGWAPGNGGGVALPAGEPGLPRPLGTRPPARQGAVPAEKGRKAARFTKHPSAARKWSGLNWRGVSHCVSSRSTELSRGTTGVPCGRAAGGPLAGHPVLPAVPWAGPGRGLLGVPLRPAPAVA